MSCGRTFSVSRTVSRGEKTDVDLMMHLSDQARATRKPGQTLQSRLLELRREHELVAPSDYAPQSGGAAIRA